MSKILKGLNESRNYGRDSWDSNMPGYQGDYGGAENFGRKKRDWDENDTIDARLRQQHAQRQEYEKSGKFWLKLKDTQRHLPAGPFIGKQAANVAAIDLLKKQPELKGNLLITAYGPDEKLNELSPETLASYKKKAGQQASELDKAAFSGDSDAKKKIAKANKRFSGIVKATKKEFEQDKKEIDEVQLKTMRKYFAGDKNAQDELKITQMRQYFDELRKKEEQERKRKQELQKVAKMGSGIKQGVTEATEAISEEQLEENLRKWFKEKWVRFGPDGKIRGDCARGDDSEGKPKCLPQSKAHALGKKGRASAAARKRREDPNPERSGKAINVNTKKKTDEEQLDELKCWPGYTRVQGVPAGAPGSCKKKTSEDQAPMFTPEMKCPHCNGEMVSEELMNEKKDACYYKVKSRYKVWPSAYASGALVKCRKKGAANWGNKSESVAEAIRNTAEFGSRYAEQLAQKVFDQNSNLDTSGRATELLNAGYAIARAELGKIASGIFRDEDFPSDFVSSYNWLKKQGVAEAGNQSPHAKLAQLKAKYDLVLKSPNPNLTTLRKIRDQIIKLEFDLGLKEGVAETKVSKYKDLGATKNTTHFIKNVTTGKIVSPHRSRQDAEDALVASMRDSNDEFRIVRARKEGVAEGDDRGDYHSTARAANQASRTAKSKQDHAKAADLHSRAATYGLSAGQDQSVIHDHQMAAREHNRASKGLKEQGVAEEQLDEKWSQKYKDSINCSNPKGFSQKAHCAGKKKNESFVKESAIMKGLK